MLLPYFRLKEKWGCISKDMYILVLTIFGLTEAFETNLTQTF